MLVGWYLWIFFGLVIFAFQIQSRNLMDICPSKNIWVISWKRATYIFKYFSFDHKAPVYIRIIFFKYNKAGLQKLEGILWAFHCKLAASSRAISFHVVLIKSRTSLIVNVFQISTTETSSYTTRLTNVVYWAH